MESSRMVSTAAAKEDNRKSEKPLVCPCHRRRSQGDNSSTSPLQTKIIQTHNLKQKDDLCTTSAVFCSVCVRAYLQEARQGRARVLKENEKIRKECQQRMDQSQPLAELQHELIDLHKRSEKLRTVANRLAIQTARIAYENEERKTALSARSSQVMSQRDILRRWQSSLLDEEKGSLTNGVLQASQKVRCIRFQWAVQAFRMHRVDIHHEDLEMTPRMKHARGIGKIGGLPLPHAGPELYSFLPPVELQSALRLVASLTSLVASCLGIVLPHPILLKANGPIGDLAANTNGETPFVTQVHPPNKPYSSATRHKSNASVKTDSPSSFSSSTSLASYVGQTARRVLGPTASEAWGSVTSGTPSSSEIGAAAGSVADTTTSSASAVGTASASAVGTTAPIEGRLVQQRIHHATSAVLAESHVTSNNGPQATGQHYSLSAAAMHKPDAEEFAIALQLLQNDIVALCIRAGAPVSKLWPAEAVLLNLNVLQDFCREQARGLVAANGSGAQDENDASVKTSDDARG